MLTDMIPANGGDKDAFQFHDFFMVIFTHYIDRKQIFEDKAAEFVSAACQSVFLCLGRTQICTFDAVFYLYQLGKRHDIEHISGV